MSRASDTPAAWARIDHRQLSIAEMHCIAKAAAAVIGAADIKLVPQPLDVERVLARCVAVIAGQAWRCSAFKTCAELLIGENPLDVERLWDKLLYRQRLLRPPRPRDAVHLGDRQLPVVDPRPGGRRVAGATHCARRRE